MPQALRRPLATSLVSLTLSAGVICAWLALHIFAVWHLDAVAQPLLAVLCLIGLTWLSVGLFIVAHDAMHGAVAPGRPRLNAAVGGLALMLYAGFSWRKLIVKHMAHHRHAGTDDDPDFGHGGPVRWYADFVRTYFGLREVLVLGGSVILYALILGPHWPYVAFWSVPSILASMQLFVFGTWLPHRPGHDEFPDRHNARSTRVSDPLSLLTCFHFGGYHHEHHLHPSVPWWRLPLDPQDPRMSILGPLLIIVLTVVVMEAVAYSVHRWIMHGPLGWGWHKSHHEDRHGPFEKNDLYAVVFAGLSIVLFMVGSHWWPWLWWVAVGMSVYGVIYFIVHDGLVHQRWPFRYVPRRGYFRRLYQAHRLHHAVEGRDDCVSFGFVYAPPVDDLKARLKASGVLAQRQSRHQDAWRPDRGED